MKYFINCILVLLFGVLVFACSKVEPDPGIGQNAVASDCGGFDGDMGFFEGDSRGDTDEGTWEMLRWMVVSLDNSSGSTVSFLNTDICLNCCGEHTTAIYLDEESGIYEIAQTDAPLMTSSGEESRCSCHCSFDYGVELPGILTDTINIKLTREITDSDEGRFTVWEGQIDLNLGSGQIHVEQASCL